MHVKNLHLPLARECPPPAQTDHALVFGDMYTYGSSAIYRCMPGYIPVEGDTERPCLASGRWGGDQLVCESKLIERNY